MTWTKDNDMAAEVSDAIDYGTSEQAKAIRVLRRFMCTKIGIEFVEHGILKPFGYTAVKIERQQDERQQDDLD